MPAAKRRRSSATYIRPSGQRINIRDRRYKRPDRNRRIAVPRDKLGFPQSISATLRYTEVADW